jgi:hypothetical protein
MLNLLVPILIGGMTLFAVITAFREIREYRLAVEGEPQYLVSKQRRNRRLLISFLLLTEAFLLFLGFFVLHFQAGAALVFWLAPMFLIAAVVHLSLQDWKETRRDVDRIFKEAYSSALKKIENSKSEVETSKEVHDPEFKS